VNYLIPGLLLLISCVSGYADQRNQSNLKVTKSSPQTLAATTTSTSADELTNAPGEKVNDPFERINRSTFRLNDSLTIHVAKPVARTYEHIVPHKVRSAVSNFFYNLDFPVRFANDVLQGRIKRSGQEVSMFIINTTAGVAGFIRVSDHVPTLVDVPPEDFGLTLARWGFSPGPYMVVPVLGPSTIRDSVGLGGDFALNPLNWYQLGVFAHNYIPTWANYTLGGARVISGLPGGVRTYEQMKETAIDPYIAVRNAYLSHRAAQLQK
jgi:phospholipid-binding lipoprotein MlaA